MQVIRCCLFLHGSKLCYNKFLRGFKTETVMKQVLNFQAEIGTGGEQIIKTMTDANGATAEVDCGNDAKLTFMGM